MLFWLLSCGMTGRIWKRMKHWNESRQSKKGERCRCKEDSAWNLPYRSLNLEITRPVFHLFLIIIMPVTYYWIPLCHFHSFHHPPNLSCEQVCNAPIKVHSWVSSQWATRHQETLNLTFSILFLLCQNLRHTFRKPEKQTFYNTKFLI